MKGLALVITLMAMLLPAQALGELQTVRDARGKVIERRQVSGNVVKIYDPSGKLIRVQTTTAMPGGQPAKPSDVLRKPAAATAPGEYELTRVRDAYGRLLRKQRSRRRGDGLVVTRVTDRKGHLVEERKTSVRQDGAYITRIKNSKGASQGKWVTKDGVTKVYGPRGNLLRTEWINPVKPKKKTKRTKRTKR